MATPGDVLLQARKHLGYVEGPRDNETPFGARTGYNFQPWCGSFVNCVLQDAGQHGEPSSVYTPSGAAAYRKLGRWIERNGPAQQGDIVFFDWGGSTESSRVDHVGIVEEILPNGTVQTIEGNTSPTNAGSQSNGGGVYRRIRQRNSVAGFGRPAYSSQTTPQVPIDWNAVRRLAAANIINLGLGGISTIKNGSRGGAVVLWQQAINLVSGAKLAEDGDFGNSTRRKTIDFQKFFGLGADGIVGPQTRSMMLLILSKIRDGS